MCLQAATPTDPGVRIISCEYFEINFIMQKVPFYSSFFFAPIFPEPLLFDSVGLVDTQSDAG
jgi:hypothetical protein